MIWRQLFLSAALLTSLAGVAQADAQKITLLSFNMWGAGANEQKPIDVTVAVIKASGADIIGVQETVPEPDPCTADVCAATDNSRPRMSLRPLATTTTNSSITRTTTGRMRLSASIPSERKRQMGGC
ncbi:MAG: endonuclease/exonuclease/phosphatase family protein [Aestuariivirga sp.]|nr:endonuclease/exonuclease/phosphatase family protein [Aestuariivirga sp.]